MPRTRADTEATLGIVGEKHPDNDGQRHALGLCALGGPVRVTLSMAIEVCIGIVENYRYYIEIYYSMQTVLQEEVPLGKHRKNEEYETSFPGLAVSSSPSHDLA